MEVRERRVEVGQEPQEVVMLAAERRDCSALGVAGSAGRAAARSCEHASR